MHGLERNKNFNINKTVNNNKINCMLLLGLSNRLIAINCIQNKSFCLHKIYFLNIYMYVCVFIYTNKYIHNTHIYYVNKLLLGCD